MKNHEISRDYTRPEIRKQNSDLCSLTQSCIFTISRGINPFRVFGDVGRAHDV
jgi:hypothetical protein